MQIGKKILKVLKSEPKKVFVMGDLLGDNSLGGIKKKDLKRAIRILADEGRLVIVGRGFRYFGPDETLTGRFSSTTRGYGFVVTEIGDFFISESNVKGAMNGDELIVRRVKKPRSSRKLAGEIVEITRRAHSVIVGRLEKNRGITSVTPANKKISHTAHIPKGMEKKANTGDIVVIKIDAWPDGRNSLQGHVSEVLGKEGEPGVDIETIIYSYGLLTEFSTGHAEELEKVDAKINDHEIKRRTDLRDIFTVTIDGLDAKDFDDAISLDVDEDGVFNLMVHIADVSHYVKSGSVIDEDAYDRGTSVYLPGRVIPMLSEKLSNDICSLKPDVNRLTFTVKMKVDESGEVVEYDFFESVIRSDYRLTYEEVDRYIEADNYPDETLRKLIKQLDLLSCLLSKKRIARGSLEFETIEPKFELNEIGWPVDIDVRQRTAATTIIEEAMILTNETVAGFMGENEHPMIYRIHDKPEPDALVEIGELLKELGYPIGSLEEAHPRTFQALIDYAHDRPEKILINSLLLRSMQQAVYSSESKGHFGLASGMYTHFTSPIRRYPDLVVHRLLKKSLIGDKALKANAERIGEDIEEIAKACSVKERVAVNAERESVDLKMSQYMSGHIGDVFAGIISGISSFGLFVRLSNSAEGLVHVRRLGDDYYHFDSKRYILVGERGKKIFRLGQRVSVKVENVSIPKREIDLVIEE